ncbi:MAG: ribosome maturation factor RimP [Ignavibacteriae bacterium]|nr:ribosome maturation factor RimP [Ignavibacteriota bacterium]
MKNFIKMDIAEQIVRLAQPIIEAKDAYLIELKVRGKGRNRIIEAFIDTDTGVTTDLCAEISRELSTALDAADIIRGPYHLIVSSPGLDRPLKFPRQYQKNIERTLLVKVLSNGAVEKIEGKLTEATTEHITLLLKNAEQRTIPFDQIIDARVQTIW